MITRQEEATNISCLDFQGDARAGLEVAHGVGVVRDNPPVRPQQLLRADFPEVQHLQARNLGASKFVVVVFAAKRAMCMNIAC